MERFSTSCILATLFVFAISPAANAQKWARDMFKDFSHDFGTVAAGAKVQYAFEFSNPYLEDAHIQSVRTSCGCTKVDYPKETIKTYQKSRILATVDTLSFKGYKGATISVVFDKPFPAEVQLQVRTYIRQDVVFHPGEVRFGAVGKGEKVSKKISIGYAGRSDWAIKSVKPPSKYLKTRLVEDVRSAGQVRYTLHVELDPEAPVGYLDGQIILQTNDYDAKRAQVPLAVSGMVEPPIEVRPSSLTFLGSPDGHEVVRNLIVKGHTPFKILGVNCDDQRISSSHSEKQSKIHIIRVVFKPDFSPGKKAGNISIRTDMPNETPLEVKFLTETIEANGNGDAEPSWQAGTPKDKDNTLEPLDDQG
ncbi:MAG: DUF1573 domain-containing protein [Planctomycetia bacterium]|jgi:hypothetical protein